jgi:tRNA (guanine37-N1)-methyltransferase
MVQPGECVIDMFAGVGPFSIMIAKKVENVNVDAVDSNPDAVRLLEENVKLNKLRGSLKTWLGDVRTVVKQHLIGTASRVIMNYPSDAKDFVETACRALQKNGGTIHYYTFADGLHCEDKAVNEFERALGSTSWGMKRMMGARRVRGVAPMKWQVVIDALVSMN